MTTTKKDMRALAGETTAVILAAGLGSRLKHNTTDRPKCLVRVAGTPILKHMIDALTEQGVHNVVIAIGYLGSHIRQFVTANYPDLNVKFIENPDYAITGSVYSLNLALRAVPQDHHLLLVEGDVVLAPELITATLETADEAEHAATLLAKYEPILSGTFALVENGMVSAWVHESVRAKNFPLQNSFKTVNITFVRKSKPLSELREAILNTIAANGEKAPLEYAMQSLVLKGMQIAAVDTEHFPWFEVDTPEDLDIANNLFATETLSA